MSVRFSGYQASLNHACSTSSPTPYSRFAVRYVHGFCLMLPSDTPISGHALALLASSFRPVTADHNVPVPLERQPVRHARHTSLHVQRALPLNSDHALRAWVSMVSLNRMYRLSCRCDDFVIINLSFVHFVWVGAIALVYLLHKIGIETYE